MPYVLKGARHTWVAPDVSTDEARQKLTERFMAWREARARARALHENTFIQPTTDPKDRDVYPGPTRADMARMDWGTYFEQV